MDFDYTIANKQVTITTYTGTSKNVTIPNEIENLPVTTIRQWAFYDKNLTSISLPQNLTAIGKGALCRNYLTSISLPQNLTTIGSHAFHTNNLTSIDFPQNLTTIEENAFCYNNLTSINNLPQTLTTIGQYAFFDTKLTSICLSQNITTIGQAAFFHNNKLTSISLLNMFKTEQQIKKIFGIGLEEFNNINRKFIKPHLAEILGDDIHHHFHDIIASYTTPSNELIQEAIEAIEA
jgi:hypothetical protein